MSVDQHTISAVIREIGYVPVITSATVTMDESWSPYIQSSFTCELPSSAIRALIDLRNSDLTLSVHMQQDFGNAWGPADLTAAGGNSVAGLTALLGGGPLSNLTNRFYIPFAGSVVRPSISRDLVLLITERTFDDVAKTMVIKAESYEAQLVSDALIATTPRDPGTTSIKAITQQVLTRFGLTLDPASLDAVVANAPATIWQPGIGDWAYLDAMLEAVSLRLWVDETGTPKITARQYTAPGTVTLSTNVQLTGHVDLMNYDPNVWVDAVVVTYRWVDALGVSQVQYDAAGASPANSVGLELRETIYPGPGAAAGILARSAGRGRVLELSALSDYTTTPGMGAVINPPESPAQTGYVSAVTWEFPGAEMKVGTRGLSDTPIDAWNFGTEKTWNAGDAVMTWNTFDWSTF